MMKKTLTVLACLALAPTAMAGYQVNAPFPGTVKLHRNSSGIPNAVDIFSGSCGYWGVETAVVGSLSWNVTIRTTGIVCYGNGSGNQNEVKHVFADSTTFRQWHFIKNTYSYDRTCDRCQIGDEGGTGNVTGAHSHLQYDKLGTLLTGWISPDLVDGQGVSGPIGYLP
ncbi:hypothetical protein [Archangium sp.]|uniref:hypothetical protein n=1 Tax=Archangium sp. TaxID=1872627 RepID=UPI002D2785A6|nr:hypothetical protein [Archangium sp.]HYO51167.1 hypothetical protein [Archangium sp.]